MEDYDFTPAGISQQHIESYDIPCSAASAAHLMQPLTIDVNADANSGTVLSRTLKRKFTELEEITQRLKARLFDVTGDVNIDPDDEFENDLNTHPDEDEDDMLHELVAGTEQQQHQQQPQLQPQSQQPDFDWLRSPLTMPQSNAIFVGQAAEYQHNMATSSAFEQMIANDGAATIAPGLYTKMTELSALPQIGADYCINPNCQSTDKQHQDCEASNSIWESLFKGNVFAADPDKITNDSVSEKGPRITGLVDTSDEGDSSSDLDHQNVDNGSSEESSSSEQERIRLISRALQRAVISDLGPVSPAAEVSPRRLDK